MGDARKHNTLVFEHNPADPSAGCAACYVGEITRHFNVFNTRVREHLETASLTHFQAPGELVSMSLCMLPWQFCHHPSGILASSLPILWDKSTLNAQVKHVNLKLSLNYYCHSLNYCYYYCNFSSIFISLEFIVHFTLKMAEAIAETCL